MQDGPAHLFSDLLDFLPDDVRILCDDDTVPKDVLKARIMVCRTKPKARCLRCRAECAITKSDIHWAGTRARIHRRSTLADVISKDLGRRSFGRGRRWSTRSGSPSYSMRT